jgi:hypothetical protein
MWALPVRWRPVQVRHAAAVGRTCVFEIAIRGLRGHREHAEAGYDVGGYLAGYSHANLIR